MKQPVKRVHIRFEVPEYSRTQMWLLTDAQVRSGHDIGVERMYEKIMLEGIKVYTQSLNLRFDKKNPTLLLSNEVKQQRKKGTRKPV